MNIKIICVGKLKEKYWIDALAEYSKRLSRYAKTDIIQIPDEKIPDNPSDKECEIIKDKEAAAIQKYLKNNDYIISLCVEGKQMDSIAFAGHIKQLGIDGVSNIAFIIGGSLGLDECIKQMSQMRLSFSKMTFPHQLMRVVLAEQIYRAFKIINGEIYHK